MDRSVRDSVPDGSLPRAILLDFYGTVVEEDDLPIAEICTAIANASPLPMDTQDVAFYWGRVFSQLCRQSCGGAFRLQKELELVSLERVLDHFQALDASALSQVLYNHWARPGLFPESRHVLSKCTIPVCLVSNIDNTELYWALDHTGLHFDLIVTSEDCRSYKPRPQMFRKALSLLRMRPEEVVHVGDSLSSDVKGAKPLGIPVLWINR